MKTCDTCKHWGDTLPPHMTEGWSAGQIDNVRFCNSPQTPQGQWINAEASGCLFHQKRETP